MVSTPQKPAVVLIADDQPELREALGAENLTVIEAADSASCLRTCQQLHPDLIILSGELPGALDLCRTLKATPGLRRIFILVTLENAEAMDAFFEAEVDDCIVKPAAPTLLLNRARLLIRQAVLEQQVAFQGEILSQMADAVVAVDSDSNVIYWNPEAEQVYGRLAEDVLGRPLDQVYQIEGFTPEQRSEVVTDAAQEGWRGEGVHIKLNGERMPVEVTVKSLLDEAGRAAGHITVIRDISKRREMEAALREQRELAEALRDTVAALTRTLDPQAVMRLLLEHLGRVVPNKTANIILIEGDRARVGFSRGYTQDEEITLERTTFSPYDMPTYRKMLATAQSYLSADTANDPLWTDSLMLPWVRSYLGTPIRAYDHVIGFLNIDSDVPNTFTPVHAERLRVFADQAAIAIENAQLYDAIYRDAVEMRILHKATDFLYATNLFTSDKMSDIGEEIVRVVVNEFGKLDCGVLLIEEGSDELVRVARTGAFHVNAMQTLYLDGPGLVPAAVRSGKTIYAPDVNADTRYASNNQGTCSELVIPMRTPKRIIGVLDMQSAEYNAFDEHDVRILEVFAERAATALENVKLYSQIRHYAEELEERVQERTGELNRVKERVEAILNHSSDAILLARPNGAIQQGNHAFDMMFGYQGDESFGKPLGEVVDPAYQDALAQALDRVLDKRNPERLELLARRSNGLTFDADVMLSPVISAPEQVTSIVCSLRDITMRKRLELELRESLQKERELNELKSRFIARASHEFRTPLAVILTSSDLLRNYGNKMSDEQRDEKLSRLQKEVRNIAVMLDDLLTISKGEELKEFDPELIDLQSFARELVHEISEGIGIQHRIEVNCKGNCTSVYGDRKLIERIITNLLSNAIKYSPPGSTIQINVTCNTTRTVLLVKDEGIGIPREDQERLFEAFHRAKNVDHISGTGLGLAIVKQAVELHGGEVTVDSQLGKGTVFTVILPNLAVKEKLQ